VNVRRVLEEVVPRSWLRVHRWLAATADRPFRGLPPAEIFEAVYRRRAWGGGRSHDFYSGHGSHDAAIVGPYVAALTDFLESLPERPRAVDLGCGDFAVGAQLRHLCSEYVACDVAPSLIERNRRVFATDGVEFRALDIATESLPSGDVAFLRQVLQHMSNAQIQELLPKLEQYRWLIVTEHVPAEPGFVPNLEKPPGPGIRLCRDSGVALEAPPFHFRSRSLRELCAVRLELGAIRTALYEPRA
jgi:hypothetical protein